MCSYHVPSIRLCMTSIYSFHLFINNLRIYYLLMYSLFRIHYSFIQYLLFKYVFVYVFTIYSTIYLYVFYYSLIHILLFTYVFTIHYSLFTIYHLLLIIYYLGENSYLVEFDETPIFWYPCVARDA